MTQPLFSKKGAGFPPFLKSGQYFSNLNFFWPLLIFDMSMDLYVVTTYILLFSKVAQNFYLNLFKYTTQNTCIIWHDKSITITISPMRPKQSYKSPAGLRGLPRLAGKGCSGRAPCGAYTSTGPGFSGRRQTDRRRTEKGRPWCGTLLPHLLEHLRHFGCHLWSRVQVGKHSLEALRVPFCFVFLRRPLGHE